MLAGFKLTAKTCKDACPKRNRRIIAMFTDSDPPSLHASLPEVAKKTAVESWMKEDDLSEAEYEIDSRFNAGAYGLVDARTIDCYKARWINGRYCA